jgi:hypothetical protein
MREHSLFAVGIANQIVDRVSRIAKRKTASHERVGALQKLASKLGKAAARLQRACEKANRAGKSGLERTLRMRQEIVERAIHYVSSMAREALRERPRLGFGYEPAHFAQPAWERR